MARATGEIRKDLDATRDRVGDEIEALSYKTDVGARLDDYVDEKKVAVKGKVRGAKDAVTSAAGSVVPSGARLGGLKDTAERNPLGLAVAGAAVGFVAGLLFPSTRLEDEPLGDVSDRIKESAAETGRDALDRTEDVAQSALETARQEGTQHAREFTSDLKDRVREDVLSEPAPTSVESTTTP